MYDGTVAIYDLARKSELPLYKSSTKTGKHTDPVWEVSTLYIYKIEIYIKSFN